MSVRKRSWTILGGGAALALAVTIATGALAQPVDPYAASHRKLRAERYFAYRDQVMANVKLFYFAEGCKVLPKYGAMPFRISTPDRCSSRRSPKCCPPGSGRPVAARAARPWRGRRPATAGRAVRSREAR
jgi:hypothetical protein